jgi:hypothetical protein
VDPGASPSPFDRLGANVSRVATEPIALVLMGTGTASTALLAGTDGDHELRVVVQESIGSRSFGSAAVALGWVVPALVPSTFFLGGAVTGDRDTQRAGAAALQAIVLTVTVVGSLKIATGRDFPLHGGSPDDPHRLGHPEHAHEWHPFQGNWAWPSGHAASAFALASSLTAYFRGALAVPFTLYPFATMVAAGILAGDHHWASDVIAGAAFGQAIGWNVGTGFREGADEHSRASELRVVPIATAGGAPGFGVGGRW